MRGKQGKDYIEEVSKVVDGLRGDAFITVQELGLEELGKGPLDKGKEENAEFIPEKTFTSGMDKLIIAMRAMVFPYRTHEAKEMFRHYCATSGTLSRQHGESMKQYVSRRKRCWNLICELDEEIVMSEDHRADMLLEHSGLSKREKIMIQASIQNGRDFQKVADALMLQHPRVHVNEQHRRRSEMKSKISDQDCRLEESLVTRMTDANEFKPRTHTKVPPSADRDVAYAAEEGDDDGEERHACISEVEDFVAEQGGKAVYIASSSEDERPKKTQSRQDEQ